MSNKNSKGFMGIFKKSPKRESDNGDIDIRRSRSFGTLDSLSLKPKEERIEPDPDQESKRKQEEKAELQRLQRELVQERQRAAKERQRSKVLERERVHQKEMERRREQERQRNAERQKNLVGQKNPVGQKNLEPNVSLLSATKPKETETNDDFKRDIENLELNIGDLDFRSKMMATMWMNRLRAPVQTEDEARARNIITAHLLKCRNENIFKKEPFNLPPTSDDLETIREKMYLTPDTLCNDMTLANQRETNSYVNQLFHDSYDGGEFLSQLPVPRDGAFFILHMRPNLKCNEI